MQFVVDVSLATYTDVRRLLPETDKSDPKAFSRFIAEAIDDRLFREAQRRVYLATSDLSEDEVMAMVDEALEDVRASR